ncbi:MAG TPA: aspartate kinase [Polyangiales bacterium]|nr:aspartate kinase [Polyangiales bacterium]
MAIVVQKYGGSSLSSIAKLHHVAERILATRAAGHDVVVVVSAMGKATEDLLALARQAAELPGTDAAAAVAPARRELDMLLSTGERVSMALLSIALTARGADAVSFTGSQSGILTNDRHFDARIIQVRPHRIEDELARGRIVIVAGYQGMSYKREVTTLGRGGSDTTAVALTAALGATQCEIYSDVDGVYSADPRTVPLAQHLPHVDYDGMQELAEAGAKVLNAQAVEWAKRSNVSILARRTSDPMEPGAGARETEVGPSSTLNRSWRAVTRDPKLAILHAERDQARAAWDTFAALELPVRDASTGPAGLVCVLPLLNVPDWTRLRAELGARGAGLRIQDENLGSVSLVGTGVGTDAQLMAELYALAEGAAVSVTSNPARISCVLPAARLADFEREFHDRFVAEQMPRAPAELRRVQ